MIGLRMRNRIENNGTAIRLVHDSFERAAAPIDVERAFACQLATSVWLRELGDAHARQALSDYVRARHRSHEAQAHLRAALEAEYHRCRERLDLCS